MNDVKHLISMVDVKDSLDSILSLANELKEKYKDGEKTDTLMYKTLAMIFEKPSTRTRVSFETAMNQLGGRAIYLNTSDMQLGRGETIADTAKVLSRYVDGIMYRAFSHEKMIELSKNSSVPVINGLDDLEHPCQVISDLFTIMEKKGRLRGIKLAYVGDGNNVCNSLILGSAISGIDISVATPQQYMPNRNIVEKAREISAGKNMITITDNPRTVVDNADVIYTDVWVSMGEETQATKKEKVFQPYQVNDTLVEYAKDDCIVMHCLPAHRGKEITDDVIDGEHSVVFDQAENRLHAQKSILMHLLTDV